jgi:hypothetical protein
LVVAMILSSSALRSGEPGGGGGFVFGLLRVGGVADELIAIAPDESVIARAAAGADVGPEAEVLDVVDDGAAVGRGVPAALGG